MKGYKYSVTVQEDPVHSYTRQTIKEVFIPECDIVFNEKLGCFNCTKERNGNYDEIEVSKKLVKLCIEHITCKERLKEESEEFFKE